MKPKNKKIIWWALKDKDDSIIHNSIGASKMQAWNNFHEHFLILKRKRDCSKIFNNKTAWEGALSLGYSFFRLEIREVKS